MSTQVKVKDMQPGDRMLFKDREGGYAYEILERFPSGPAHARHFEGRTKPTFWAKVRWADGGEGIRQWDTQGAEKTVEVSR